MLCCKKKKKNEEPSLYGKLWRTFIRPHRSEYNLRDLGPARFEIEGRRVCRTDIEIKNKRGQTIQASFFEILDSTIATNSCVLYAHTHSGSRLEALGVLVPSISNGLNMLAIDMTGSGLSDGQYVSFGINERDDIDAAVSYLRDKLRIPNVILWGRSMGAVTLIQYASEHEGALCMVLDSPFANLKRLCKEVAKKRAKVPSIITSMFLPLLKKTIRKKGQFSINDLDISSYARKVRTPTIFIASKDDIFVSHEHSVTLRDSLASAKKEIIYCKGGHNDSRPREFLKEVMKKALEYSNGNPNGNLRPKVNDFPLDSGNVGNVGNVGNKGEPFLQNQEAQALVQPQFNIPGPMTAAGQNHNHNHNFQNRVNLVEGRVNHNGRIN